MMPKPCQSAASYWNTVCGTVWVPTVKAELGGRPKTRSPLGAKLFGALNASERANIAHGTSLKYVAVIFNDEAKSNDVEQTTWY